MPQSDVQSLGDRLSIVIDRQTEYLKQIAESLHALSFSHKLLLENMPAETPLAKLQKELENEKSRSKMLQHDVRRSYETIRKLQGKEESN